MIGLAWDPRRGEAALRRTATGALAQDDGLATAVLLSLFLDRRAGPDDPLPDGTDRRGWLGDALAEDADRIGSRLWLLSREKQVEETRRRAEEYAEEALAWLVEDGLAESVAVSAAWAGIGWLDLRVTITPGLIETYPLRLG
jgi:phage gp46-like protein